jgi:hypothetical protein
MPLPCATCFPILGSSRISLGAWWGVTVGVGVVGELVRGTFFRTGREARGEGGTMGLGRLLKIPGAVAELTVGTMIVLYQLTVARAVEEKQRRLLDATRSFPTPADMPPSRGVRERVATN